MSIEPWWTAEMKADRRYAETHTFDARTGKRVAVPEAKKCACGEWLMFRRVWLCPTHGHVAPVN